MSVAIIDSFSLGTDLPLDARYVVDSYYDVSLYWFPGMQVFQTSDQRAYWYDGAIWNPFIDTSTAGEFATVVYVDGSLAARDSSISQLYLENDIQDASIIDLRGRLDIVDGSIVFLTNWNLQQDASIERIDQDIVRIDASLANIDISLGELDIWNSQQDSSIERIDGDIFRIDASLANIDISLGLMSEYVKKSGDTMTGPLILDSSLRVLENATFLANVDIAGDLRVDGSTTFLHSEVLDVSTAWINLNTGLVGSPPAWLQSGIVVERGDASAYAIIYDETRQEFRVGIVSQVDASGVYNDAETQAVATREDLPVDNGVATWNADEYRFDTSTGLTYDGSLFVDGDVSVNGRVKAYNLNINTPTLPANPEGGDMVYLPGPYNKPFWYDASRGKWTSGQVSYGMGRNSANRNTDAYMFVGAAAMTSADGILTPHNGIITGGSVSVDVPLVADRTLEIRVNDSILEAVQVTITAGNAEAWADYFNLDVSAGDIVQAVLLANGVDNVGNIIATFEITERP